jgi:hypothetical protein
VVSPALTTLGVKRRLHNKTPESRSCKVMEAVDIWVYVDTSQPWDIRGVGRLSVQSDVAR